MPAPTPAYRTIAPADLPPNDFYQFLIGSVAPRPIAFASTISAAGEVNLSPYSFFNVVSANPPMLVFSPTSRGRDNSEKDTLRNVREVAEVVINICDYPLVEQLSLASAEYPAGVNEFTKAGLTEAKSDRVRPPRVAECPVALECVVEQIIALGDGPGHGNLVLCRVVQAHFREDILLEGKPGIDPRKFEAVSRLGGDWYSRLRPENLFTVARPNRQLGIGFDELPAHIRHSNVLTGNDLARLANTERAALPTPTQVAEVRHEPQVARLLAAHPDDPAALRHQLALLARQWLEEGRVAEAWRVLLLA
ncbi:flavin reductase family protein [Hymenobacter sp. UV11]|uniref:flavin reductase family protein n=1 Tax=Hymenobacter sp. UV11 TaxID=1849735 RepID=UPI00105FA701|nr:flavin reductase family protein [Hymenobacter sp. UV11]TDN39451.1 flavin reductase [Hymenobacter sp. UV11]TFZ65457.1 flavin reductase family protein [Hymenobacter sp. UV11]